MILETEAYEEYDVFRTASLAPQMQPRLRVPRCSKSQENWFTVTVSKINDSDIPSLGNDGTLRISGEKDRVSRKGWVCRFRVQAAEIGKSRLSKLILPFSPTASNAVRGGILGSLRRS
jgi:hypothetical protein